MSANSEDHDYLFDYLGCINGLETGEKEHEREAGGHIVMSLMQSVLCVHYVA